MSHALERALERALVHAPSERLAVARSEHAAERATEREPVDGQPAAPRDAQARASALVAGIAADAAMSPEVYLRSTVVPEGGE